MSARNIKIGTIYKVKINAKGAPFRMFLVKKIWPDGSDSFFYASAFDVPPRWCEFLIIPTRIIKRGEDKWYHKGSTNYCEFIYNNKIYYTTLSGTQSLFDSKYCSSKMIARKK